jgi:hypothetical protein
MGAGSLSLQDEIPAFWIGERRNSQEDSVENTKGHRDTVGRELEAKAKDRKGTLVGERKVGPHLLFTPHEGSIWKSGVTSHTCPLGTG